MSNPYWNMGDPVIERLARAICKARRLDPELWVPATGYSDSGVIPQWWKFQDAALNTAAVLIELGIAPDKLELAP